MAFVVLYDACVLYPAPLRDLLVRLANTGVVRARWSARSSTSASATFSKTAPLKPEALQRTRELMTRAVPDCMVTGFEGLIDGLVLPDPDDRHVLAAAIRAGAQAIVTFNLDDFPADRLEPYNVEAKHPDDFVVDTIDLSPGAVAKVLAEQAAALKNPPRSVAELLGYPARPRTRPRRREAAGPVRGRRSLKRIAAHLHLAGTTAERRRLLLPASPPA